MNIIFKAVAGSHLFGLNSEKSDRDFRGVYIPEAEDILLGTIKNSIKENTNNTNTKNSAEDLDVEYYSLNKFLRMLQEGQTVALELLFTPDDKVVITTPVWEEIKANRDKLIHKKVTAFIGYAKTQASKYGIRGSRMGSLKKTIEIIDNLLQLDQVIARHSMATIWEILRESTKNLEHVEFTYIPSQKNNPDSTREHFVIIGKKFQKSMKIGQFVDTLVGIYEEYGARTELARINQGVDWKAISHARRVCWQGKELLQTGKITLPLPEPIRTEIMMTKQGKLTFAEVSVKLEQELEDLLKMEKISNLPEKINNDFINNMICKYYGDVIKG